MQFLGSVSTGRDRLGRLLAESNALPFLPQASLLRRRTAPELRPEVLFHPSWGHLLVRLAKHYVLQNTASACRKATAIYQIGIEHDPANVKARAGLADSLPMRFIFGGLDLQEGVGAAVSVLAKASEIDHESAEVHLSHSRLHCVWDWQWQRAADELQHRLELATDDVTAFTGRAWQGVYFARMGDCDRGLRQLHQASRAFPLSAHVWFFLAEALSWRVISWAPLRQARKACNCTRTAGSSRNGS